MKNLLRTSMLVCLAVLAMIFVSCTLPQGDQEEPNGPVDSNLLGRWISAAGSSFEFKSDNTLAVVLTTGGSPIGYKYDATGGSGHYWVAGTPKAAAQLFTYSIAGSALALKFAGIDYSLLKEGTVPKSVYAVGIAYTGSSTSNAQAYYWKDNVPTKLETPTGATGALAVHMYAVGSTTYIIGSASGAGDGYWQDGVWHSFPGFRFSNAGFEVGDLSTLAYFSATDIYLVGYRTISGHQENGYYKNGVWYSLEDATLKDVRPLGVAVDGADTYLYGYYRILQGVETIQKACYWKNGVRYTLTGASTEKESIATAMTISGTDVRIGGNYKRSDNSYNMGYWKNGVWWKTLKTATQGYMPTSLVMDGSDLYLAYIMVDPVSKGGKSGYFKNGVVNALPDSGSKVPFALSFEKDGPDLYMGGCYADYTAQTFEGGYWKNGVWNPLALPAASTACIAFATLLK